MYSNGWGLSTAFIQFTSRGDSNDVSTVNIGAEKTSSALRFNKTDSNLNDRVSLDSSVQWSIEKWQSQLVYDTPDITSLITPVFGKPIAPTLGSIAFIIETEEDGNTAAYAFDDDPDRVAVLKLTFE